MVRSKPFQPSVRRAAKGSVSALWLILVVSAATEASAVTFRDIARDGGAGLTYRRVPSRKNTIVEALKQKPTVTREEILGMPDKPYGGPGVVIFDYDRDGDLDLYVTNGPGAANSLFANQLRETGQVSFVDVAGAAGVAATDHDSSGVVAGDIDNDGDQDLLVLGGGEPNRLFENLGNGRFRDISASSGIGGGNFHHSSASLGDVNGDGLLDLFVGNAADLSLRPFLAEPWALNHPNQLFLNRGGNRFEDVSDSSGIRNLSGFTPPQPAGRATITWAAAMVDYDLDGDLDIFHGDDQAATPNARQGGDTRGIIHLLQNDGTGHFTDVSALAGTNKVGQWMGLSFADFNSDGLMDFFGTSMGDYAFTMMDPTYPRGESASRWFLGQPGGTFADPGVGELVATPFAWGTSAFDYDNDGDTDVAIFGGLDAGTFFEASNPGAVLRNDGAANFTYDADALDRATNHSRRYTQGLAVGDLNNDGFAEIVSVSSSEFPEPAALVRYPTEYGSPFDATAFFIPLMTPVGTPPPPGMLADQYTWNPVEVTGGTLSVNLNSADNGNGWIEVRVVGAKGILPTGRVNRDGIGAVVLFTPDGGKTVMKPIMGGSNYASRDSLRTAFGLGAAQKGTVEVRWPGGGRTRIFDVRRGERIVVPELPGVPVARANGPFSYIGLTDYVATVRSALDRLASAGMLEGMDRERLMASALWAFSEFR